MDNAMNNQVEPSAALRKPWEEPKIVLERSLFASAQGGPPGSPQGFLGPLTASGGAGTCLPPPTTTAGQ
jgi:hypothetical protein